MKIKPTMYNIYWHGEYVATTNNLDKWLEENNSDDFVEENNSDDFEIKWAIDEQEEQEVFTRRSVDEADE